jgi:cytochrome c
MFVTELTFTSSQAKNVTLRFLFVAGVLLLCRSNAYADIEQAKRIYRENCAPCHGESGKAMEWAHDRCRCVQPIIPTLQ